MTPFYADDHVTVHHGDCLDVLRTLPDCSVDSVVTDPPAGAAFMGKDWDTDKGGRDAWVAWLASVLAECRRVLKPGGHALVWALPRTSGWTHRAIEDAGLDVRDCITHLFGSGFPKSLDVGKAIDRERRDDVTHVTAYLRTHRGSRPLGEIVKALGFAGTHGTHGVAAFFSEHPSKARVPSPAQWEALRAFLGFGSEMDAEVARLNARKGTPSEDYLSRPEADYESRPGMAESWRDGKGWTGSLARGGDPVREDAARWDGWGTALKPASEMWYLARKPLAGTVAANVTTWGTGALNIAATRVPGVLGGDPNRFAKTDGGSFASFGDRPPVVRSEGRWPSNAVLSHHESCEPVGVRQVRASAGGTRKSVGVLKHDGMNGRPQHAEEGGDTERTTYAASDGAETVQAWECEPSCPVAELDAQSGPLPTQDHTRLTNTSRTAGDVGFSTGAAARYPDTKGSAASRYFPVFRYQAKAPTRERPSYEREGAADHRTGGNFAGGIRVCNVCQNRTKPGNWTPGDPRPWPGCGHDDWVWGDPKPTTGKVAHPTVKPLALMAWLCRLVTPPGGVILDPFAGSGTTAEAAILEGFRCVTIEREAEYLPLILERIRRQQTPPAGAAPKPQQMSLLDDPAA